MSGRYKTWPSPLSKSSGLVGETRLSAKCLQEHSKAGSSLQVVCEEGSLGGEAPGP